MMQPGRTTRGESAGPASRILRVLVVDDQTHFARRVRSGLAAEGVFCEIAPQPEPALEAASAQPPHVVVVDVGMPRFDALKWLRDLRARCASEVVVVARGMPARTDLCGLFGARWVLHKPCPHTKVVAAVRGILCKPPV